MADNKVGEVLLELGIDTNGVDKDLNNLKGSFGGLSNSLKKIGKYAAAAFSVKKIIDFSNSCIDASNIQTEAEKKLETIMRQRMNASNEAIQSVKDYTSKLQTMGVVGDEVAMSGVQQLATFMNSTEALKTLIPAMENLAVQQNGVNVTSEAMVGIGNMMGKAMQGQVDALSRVGITMTETQKKLMKYGDEEQRAATLAEIITDNVGEMNAALANTYAGKVQQLANNFGDLKEKLGVIIKHFLKPMIDLLNKIVLQLSLAADKLKEWLGIEDDDKAVEDLAYSTAEGFEEATENAQELKKTLLGFDKINKLDGEENNEVSMNMTGLNAGFEDIKKQTEDFVKEEEKELNPFFQWIGDRVQAIKQYFDENPEIVKFLKGVVDGLLTTIGNIIDWIGLKINELTNYFKENPEAFEAFVNIIKGLAVAFGTLAASMMIGNLITKVIALFSAMNPVVAAVSGGIALLAGMITANWDTLKNMLDPQWWWDSIQAVIYCIEYAFGWIGDKIAETFGGIVDWVSEKIQWLKDGVKGIGDAVANSSIGQAVSEGWNNLTASFPHFANGGYVKANTPQLAVIGDNKTQGEYVLPENKLASLTEGKNNAEMIELLSQILTAITSLDLTANVSGNSIGNLVIKMINDKTRSTGRSPLIV